MASSVVDIDRPFGSVYEALDLKTQRKAMRGALRRESNRLRKKAVSNLQSSGIGHGTKHSLSKGIRARVYPEKYGAGFMVTVKPHKANRKTGQGEASMHRNRFYDDRTGARGRTLKGTKRALPILQWAEEGTDLRRTKTKTKIFTRKRKGHATGRMRRYGFMRKTDNQAEQIVEQNLFKDFQANIEKAARKQGLL